MFCLCHEHTNSVTLAPTKCSFIYCYDLAHSLATAGYYCGGRSLTAAVKGPAPVTATTRRPLLSTNYITHRVIQVSYALKQTPRTKDERLPPQKMKELMGHARVNDETDAANVAPAVRMRSHYTWPLHSGAFLSNRQ